MSGCGQESPSPGGARSQGKGLKVNTGLRGLAPRSRFPLAAERPLYSELVKTYMFSFFFYSEPVIREYAHVTRIHTAPTEYLYYSTIIQEYAAWKLQTPIKKKQPAKFRRLKSKGRALLIGKAKLE